MTARPGQHSRIWSLPNSLGTRRLAQALASHALAGDLADRVRDVHLLTQSDPRRGAELVLALAELAASALPPPLPTTDEEVLEALRAAHAAYARGLRLAWVVEGERDYQREKKRRARQAQLARAG
jgi:hypothetical protein